MIRARGGDRDAFAELASRTIGRLTAVARMILRDEYAAQDAVQDAYIEAWRSLPGLREPRRFEAWLRRLLVRACFKGVRRRRRVQSVEIRLTPADEPAITGGERALQLHDQIEHWCYDNAEAERKADEADRRNKAAEAEAARE